MLSLLAHIGTWLVITNTKCIDIKAITKGTAPHSKQTYPTQTKSLTLFNRCTKEASSKPIS